MNINQGDQIFTSNKEHQTGGAQYRLRENDV